MTTVSVQPMKSEPNKREEFKRDALPYGYDLTKAICGCCEYADENTESRWLGWQSAWQHQQKRIVELEASVKFWQENSVDLEYKCLDKNLANESLQAKCVLLEKQNTVAVEALEQIEDWKFGWDGDCGVTSKASEALAEINRLQDKPAEEE